MKTSKDLRELERRINEYASMMDWYGSVIDNLKGTPEEFVDKKYLKDALSIVETIQSFLPIETYIEHYEKLNSK